MVLKGDHELFLGRRAWLVEWCKPNKVTHRGGNSTVVQEVGQAPTSGWFGLSPTAAQQESCSFSEQKHWTHYAIL
jgi:hypothetical protein